MFDEGASWCFLTAGMLSQFPGFSKTTLFRTDSLLTGPASTQPATARSFERRSTYYLQLSVFSCVPWKSSKGRGLTAIESRLRSAELKKAALDVREPCKK